jgi:hypothetical protein
MGQGAVLKEQDGVCMLDIQQIEVQGLPKMQ